MTAPDQPLITENEVKKVAHLARLRLDEHNVATYTKSLANILDMIAKINDIDTKNIIPMASPVQRAETPLREDLPIEDKLRDYYQRLAPAVESGLYLVPKVIE